MTPYVVFRSDFVRTLHADSECWLTAPTVFVMIEVGTEFAIATNNVLPQYESRATVRLTTETDVNRIRNQCSAGPRLGQAKLKFGLAASTISCAVAPGAYQEPN